MKLIFLGLGILLFAATTIFAQQQPLMGFSGPYPTNPVKDDLEKGNVMLSVDGLFLGGAGSAITNYQWSVSPEIGLLVARHLAVGVRLPYGRYILRTEDNLSAGTVLQDQAIQGLSPEIFARYYATPYRVKPFFQLATGYNFQFGKTEIQHSGVSQQVKSGNYLISGVLGVSFFVNRHFSMELQYNRRFLKKSVLSDANDQVKIRLGASWFIR